MTMNTERESRHERQGAFWVLVLAVAGTIAVSCWDLLCVIDWQGAEFRGTSSSIRLMIKY
jgi:hypothetical protein